MISFTLTKPLAGAIAATGACRWFGKGGVVSLTIGGGGGGAIVAGGGTSIGVEFDGGGTSIGVEFAGGAGDGGAGDGGAGDGGETGVTWGLGAGDRES